MLFALPTFRVHSKGERQEKKELTQRHKDRHRESTETSGSHIGSRLALREAPACGLNQWQPEVLPAWESLVLGARWRRRLSEP